MSAPSREPVVTNPAGSRTTLTVISLSAAAGALAGWSAYRGGKGYRPAPAQTQYPAA